MPRLLPFAIVLLTALCSSAQAPTATVSGTVTDKTGAAIPGARIAATQVRTGVVLETSTNESGVYNFPSLPLGPYRLSASPVSMSPGSAWWMATPAARAPQLCASCSPAPSPTTTPPPSRPT